MDSTGGDSVDTHLVINHGIVSASEPGQQGLTGAPLASWYQRCKEEGCAVFQAMPSQDAAHKLEKKS